MEGRFQHPSFFLFFFFGTLEVSILSAALKNILAGPVPEVALCRGVQNKNGMSHIAYF